MKKVCLMVGALLAQVMAFATPTISDMKVSSLSPWGVAIDYTMSGADEMNPNCRLEVYAVVTGVTYTAKSLLGETELADGSHRVYWNMAKDGLSFDVASASVTVRYRMPTYCVVDLSSGSSSTNYPVAYLDEPPVGGFNMNEYKTTKLVLKRVDPGRFWSDTLYHVDKTFYLGLFEVTQKQWTLICGEWPSSGNRPSDSYGRGDVYPVYYVSYDKIRGANKGASWPITDDVDNESFLGGLRSRTGLFFDLPTEVQWEYACRAETETTYSYGATADGSYMRYYINSYSGAAEVGMCLPNPWGFYDMHGNVWEWCLEWQSSPMGSKNTSGSFRMIRGGAYDTMEGYCTSAYRNYRTPSTVEKDLGFRMQLSSDKTEELSETLSEVCLTSLGDGEEVGGELTIWGSAHGDRDLSIGVDGISCVVCTKEFSSFLWQPQTLGEHVLTYSIGDVQMSAKYVVTNLAFWTQAEPNPPMSVVETITIPTDGKQIRTSNRSGGTFATSGSGDWTAAVSDNWISLSATNGVAGGKVTYSVEENDAAEDRVGYIYVAGRVYAITQNGRAGTVKVNPTEASVERMGGTVPLDVTPASTSTTWRVKSECEWISVSPMDGTGTGEVTCRIAPWYELESRTGTVTVAAQTVTIVQHGSRLSLSPGAASVVADGTNGDVKVSASPNLTWTAASDADWLKVAEDSLSGEGSGTITWEALPQTTLQERIGTITVTPESASGVAETTFVVVQAAAAVAHLEIASGAEQVLGAGGGLSSFAVRVVKNSDADTDIWSAVVSDADWISLFNAENRQGDGVVDFVVDAYEGDGADRVGTISVGDQTVRITQKAQVVITAEVDGKSFVIPDSWFAQYPSLGGADAVDWQEIAVGDGLKSDASGAALPVWHDYVAGTDPTNADSRLRAEISVSDGVPVVRWDPALNGDGVREGVRRYRVYGKESLTDESWREVSEGEESQFHFFRITVEMP